MLPEHYTSPRWLLCGPKETLLLLLFFVNNFEHGWRKAMWDFRQLFCFSGKAGEACKEQQRTKDGWYPYQSPRVGQVATVWPEQPRAHMPELSPTGHEVSGRDSQKSAVHFHEGFWGLEMCFHSGVEQEPNFSNPKMFFVVVVVIVAIETSVFRLRRSGFSFRSFSTYKLTPETLKTFPWKYY